MEIREALSAAERQAAVELARRAFDRPGEPALIGRARRFRSPLRARGRTWIAFVDETPAATLLEYELVLRRGDERRPAFGLGSVATDPARRGRGIATRLCAGIAQRHGGAGLLFSAIAPRFYERLGYVALPAWNFRCTDLARLADSGPHAELEALDPRGEVDRLAAAWHAAHHGWYLDRDDARWASTLAVNPGGLWFAAGAAGYLRVVLDPDGLEVCECCVAPDERDATLRAAAALAIEAGADVVTGWLEPSPFVHEHFTDAGRAKTLPMLLGADAPESARFSSADYF